MNKFIFQISIFLIGALYSVLTFEVVPKYNVDLNDFIIIDQPHAFRNIFKTNLTVGLLMSVGGFLSGGILVLIILFWNGFFLTEIIQTSIALDIPQHEIIRGLILHGPIEITAFFLFGSIGMEGWFFYFKAFKEQKFLIKSRNILKSFLSAIILLFIAAIIEANL